MLAFDKNYMKMTTDFEKKVASVRYYLVWRKTKQDVVDSSLNKPKTAL